MLPMFVGFLVVSMAFNLLQSTTTSSDWLQRHCQQEGTRVFCSDAKLTGSDVKDLIHALPENVTLLALNKNYFRAFNIRTIKRTFVYMKELQMRHNYFQEIPWDLGHMFPNLEVLDLSSNGIFRIYREDFYGMSKLQKLDLKRNKISYLRKNAFLDLTSLQRLELQMNNLKYNGYYAIITDMSFRGLANLTYLSLRHNDLHRISSDMFKYLRHTDCHLDLAWNDIHEIKGIFQEDVKTIKRLDLSHNRIYKIHLYAFEGMNFTDENVGLDLSYNSLYSIPDALLKIKQGNVSLLHNDQLSYSQCSYKLLYQSHLIELLLPPQASELSIDDNCPLCESYDRSTNPENCRCENNNLGVCLDINGNFQACSCPQKVVLNDNIYDKTKNETQTTNTALISIAICISFAAFMVAAGFVYYVYRKYISRLQQQSQEADVAGDATDDYLTAEDDDTHETRAILPQINEDDEENDVVDGSSDNDT